MEIKDLELSEQDFDLIIEGLEALPEKGIAGEMFAGLLGAMLEDKTDEEGRKKMQKMQADREAERKRKTQEQKDDILILKGKLSMLKRWLLTQGALKQANDILGG